jgi:hypothetical protein
VSYPPIPPGNPGPPPFRRSDQRWWLWPLLLVLILAWAGTWASDMRLGPFSGVILGVIGAVATVVLVVCVLVRSGPKPPPAQPTSWPPGWYRDPAGLMRWWDGRQWTEYVKPGEQP